MKSTDNKPVYTESTQQKNNAEVTTTKNNANTWRNVLLGGIPGILIGAFGPKAVEAMAHGPINQTPEGDDLQPAEMTQQDYTISVADNVNDDMSFNEAFAAARAEVGPGGAFVWQGNVYSTYRADDPEWRNMTAEQRLEHSDTIMAQVHPTTSEHQATIASTESTEGVDVPVEPVDVQEQGQDDAGEIDVHIVGVGQVAAEDGSLVTVGYGEVDGMEAMFADSDGDGDVDTVLIDINGNGEVDENEFFNAQGSGITVDGMIEEAQANMAQQMEDQLYADMPDYTNDADVSSLS